MLSWTDERLVVAKIVSLGAKHETDLDDEFSIWFSIDVREKRHYFQIPPAPQADGYTEAQLDTIEVELLKFGIDLMPLDHHLVQ